LVGVEPCEREQRPGPRRDGQNSGRPLDLLQREAHGDAAAEMQFPAEPAVEDEVQEVVAPVVGCLDDSVELLDFCHKFWVGERQVAPQFVQDVNCL
jgi:hypothetical protein